MRETLSAAAGRLRAGSNRSCRLPRSFRPRNPEKLRRFLTVLLCAWGAVWFVAPLLALDNAFIDVPENIIWGSYFQFGYDKNPYLGAWIGYLGSLLTGNSLWNSYLLSQVFVVTGLWAVWRLSLRMTSPAGAFLAVIFLLGVNFYGIKSVELCDDVMELGFWPLLIWSFYCSLKDGNRIGSWLLTGFLAGCCFMIKYYGAVLFVSMFVVMLATPEGRRAFRRPGPYLGAVLFAVMCLPNLIWLGGNDMVAFRYAFDRAALDDGAPGLRIHLRAAAEISAAELYPDAVGADRAAHSVLPALLPARRCDAVRAVRPAVRRDPGLGAVHPDAAVLGRFGRFDQLFMGRAVLPAARAFFSCSGSSRISTLSVCGRSRGSSCCSASYS